jgi:phage-related protein
MKKLVTIDLRAEKELSGFSFEAQREFKSLIYTLKNEGKLSLPAGKKIGDNLFEIRIRVGGIYRGLYAYISRGGIIVLHFFQKKSQKTPIKDLKVARKRFKEYE